MTEEELTAATSAFAEMAVYRRGVEVGTLEIDTAERRAQGYMGAVHNFRLAVENYRASPDAGRRTTLAARLRALRDAGVAAVRDLRKAHQAILREGDRLTHSNSPSPEFLADVRAEIEGLRNEFDDVAFSARGRVDRDEEEDTPGYSGPVLTVTLREPIVLRRNSKWYDLGKFRIKFLVNAVRQTASVPNWFRVIAVTPRPAAGDESITHPHVRSTVPCLGNGVSSISRAILGGRVMSAFLLVRAVLQTYNPESPYVALENWYGDRTCRFCDEEMEDADEVRRARCPACNTRCCDDCRNGVENRGACETCGARDNRCSNCRVNPLFRCKFCNKGMCHGCAKTTPQGNMGCQACLKKCAYCVPDRWLRRLDRGRCARCVAAGRLPVEPPTVPEAAETTSTTTVTAVSET